ncbi:MAG: glycoside hydrolase family 130 protein [Phycisphaerae bacterium]|nr:glycoside hydrolase family 130 protein [Phycisphaerae bacterium]
MRMQRYQNNPLVSPSDVKPSRPELKVVCAFNAAAIEHDGQILLLLRIAETAHESPPDYITFPVVEQTDSGPVVALKAIKKNSPDLDDSDPRMIIYHGQPYLTTLSHLRLARSSDGRDFTVNDTPAMLPQSPIESFGLEDPRITLIDGRYYITHTAVSSHGIATALAWTTDFKTFNRHGLIFAPEDRDVVIFPEKIDGQYLAFHRPYPKHIGTPAMWLARSPDLLHWGHHQKLIDVRSDCWDCVRVGAGAVPFRTPRGWLEIYHGADKDNRYCLGAVLLDSDDPSRLLARSAQPLLAPEAPYELTGLLGNVVFTCGAITSNPDEILLYYGAADSVTALAVTSVNEILDSLEPL